MSSSIKPSPNPLPKGEGNQKRLPEQILDSLTMLMPLKGRAKFTSPLRGYSVYEAKALERRILVSSITTWMRLEAGTRTGSISTGLQARIYDPLWLLARQWLVGEFQGEDKVSLAQAW